MVIGMVERGGQVRATVLDNRRKSDEQAFRYNNRTATDAERFVSVMKQIVGRRVTYKELTGKTESGRKPLLPESARDAESESAF